jgi:hypothetical protein
LTSKHEISTSKKKKFNNKKQAFVCASQTVSAMSPEISIRHQLHELTLAQVTYGLLLMCMPYVAVDHLKEQVLFKLSREGRHAVFRLLLAIDAKTLEFCDWLTKCGKLPFKRDRYKLRNSVAKVSLLTINVLFK